MNRTLVKPECIEKLDFTRTLWAVGGPVANFEKRRISLLWEVD